MERGEFEPHAVAQRGVEVRQGLVEQEDVGLADDRAADRDPLALPARQRGGLALEKIVESENARRASHRGVDVGLGTLGEAQRERHIFIDGKVWI